MSIEFGYKVLNEWGPRDVYGNDGEVKYSEYQYYSIIAQMAGSRRYYINTWTYPGEDNGPLTVFDDKEFASRFIDDYALTRPVLTECLYEPSNSEIVWGQLHRKIAKEVAALPIGTILAKRVKVIRIIGKSIAKTLISDKKYW